MDEDKTVRATKARAPEKFTVKGGGAKICDKAVKESGEDSVPNKKGVTRASQQSKLGPSQVCCQVWMAPVEKVRMSKKFSEKLRA